MPSASELQSYLNDTIWGKQANVYCTVTRSDATVNYDLNRDGMLENTDTEELEVSVAVKDESKDINIYYYKYGSISYAHTHLQECFIQDAHPNSAVNITAHEVGHALGDYGDSDDEADLMLYYASSGNPTRIIKLDWDLVNPP